MHERVWLGIFGGLIAIFAIVVLLAEPPLPKAALIPITGEIGFGSLEASPEYLEENIKRTEKDNNVKAVVFLINSPGGSAVASREIARMIAAIEKPTVCWLGDIAASGAYWLATSCSAIVADELTVTGSIGVTASYLEFSGLLEKYGIEYRQLTSGKHKDIASPYRDLTKEEEEIMRSFIDGVYRAFAESVSRGRNVSEEALSSLEGRIVLGKEAKELGLVDVLGGREEVLGVIKEKTKEDVELVSYKTDNELERLLRYLPQSTSSPLPAFFPLSSCPAGSRLC